MSSVETTDIYKRIVALRESGGEAVLVTVISCKGSTPRKQGAKMLVYADGSICGTVGGGIREGDIINMARDLLSSSQQTRMASVDFNEGLTGGSGPVCGGIMEVFMERIGGKQTLVIGGAGHIGLYLYQGALMLDYRVVIIDPRPELNNPERFPEAELLVRQFEAGLDDLELGGGDAVVLVGPGHDADQALLPSVLDSGAGYIGMIGSSRKKAEVFKAMQADHGFSDEQLARIYSPVGLDIGSESPAEIALSILAEMVGHFKKRADEGE